MIATPQLRFVERKYKMSPFYRAPDGGPAYQTLRILQQYWSTIATDPMLTFVPIGEWRDVPLVSEDGAE